MLPYLFAPSQISRILVYPSMRPHATLEVPGVRKVRQSRVSRRKILSVCPVCSDPITDDLENVVFVQDVWPEHMGLWPGDMADLHDVAFVAERAAEGAYLAASAAVRASFATLNRARAGSLTPAQKQQVNELLEAMMRGDVVM